MIAYRNRKNYQSYNKPKSFLERSPQPYQGGMRFSKTFCTYCHKIGHTRNECRNRKGKQTYPEYKHRMQGHMAEYGEDDEEKVENEQEEVYDDLL